MGQDDEIGQDDGISLVGHQPGKLKKKIEETKRKYLVQKENQMILSKKKSNKEYNEHFDHCTDFVNDSQNRSNDQNDYEFFTCFSKKF